MKQTGIYILTNRVNGKQYVGQSVDLHKRVQKHLSFTKGCPAIRGALQKYGRSVFDVQLIPYPAISSDALNAVERWHIARLDTLAPKGYNLRAGGEGGGSPSEVTRQKLRVANLGKTLSTTHREALRLANTGENNPNYGKKMSEVLKQQIAEKQRGKTHTAASRAKISKNNVGFKRQNTYRGNKAEIARTSPAQTPKSRVDVYFIVSALLV